MPQPFDDPQRSRNDDVDSAAEGREPDLVRRHFGEAVHPEVAQPFGQSRSQPVEAQNPPRSAA